MLIIFHLVSLIIIYAWMLVVVVVFNYVIIISLPLLNFFKAFLVA